MVGEKMWDLFCRENQILPAEIIEAVILQLLCALSGYHKRFSARNVFHYICQPILGLTLKLDLHLG